MARLRTPGGAWTLESARQIPAGPLPDAIAQYLTRLVADLVRLLVGRISLGTGGDGSWSGNVDGQYVVASCPGAATTFAIGHGLGRVPVGAIVVAKTAACDIYTAPDIAWSADFLYLRGTAAASLKLLIW